MTKEKQDETKEIATTQEAQAPSTQVGALKLPEGFGAIDPSQITIPYIQLLQTNSKILNERDDLKAGQVIESLSGEVLADKGQPLELVIFYLRKYYKKEIKKHGESKWSYLEVIPYTGQKLPYHDEVGSSEGEVRNVYTVDYFCVVPGVGGLFKMLSVANGSKLKTKVNKHFATRIVEKMLETDGAYQLRDSVWTLTTAKEEGDDSSWLVPQLKLTREATDTEKAQADKWADLAKSFAQSGKQVEGEEAVAAEDEDVPF
jgi:hypothetical protein